MNEFIPYKPILYCIVTLHSGSSSRRFATAAIAPSKAVKLASNSGADFAAYWYLVQIGPSSGSLAKTPRLPQHGKNLIDNCKCKCSLQQFPSRRFIYISPTEYSQEILPMWLVCAPVNASNTRQVPLTITHLANRIKNSFRNVLVGKLTDI